MERIGFPSSAFEFVTLEKIIKEVNKLSIKKATQTLDILAKITEENKDLLSHFVYMNFINALSSSRYPNDLKYANVMSTTQKMKFSIKGFFSKCDQIRRNKLC